MPITPTSDAMNPINSERHFDVEGSICAGETRLDSSSGSAEASVSVSASGSVSVSDSASFRSRATSVDLLIRGDRRRSFRDRVSFAATVLIFFSGAFATAWGSKVETWKVESQAAFFKGKRERVIVSDTGRVRLSLGLAGDNAKGLSARRVWKLVRTSDGSIYAATGDEGKVFKLVPKTDAWTIALDAADTQIFSLAVLPDGKVMAGTGAGGQVIDVSSADHPASRPDPAVKYIWDLAADKGGNLYAATGPSGQLWKRAGDGKWTLVLDTKHSHLLSVAVGINGEVYAGSDGDGLIYKIVDGKTSVVYDSPQTEIRSLLVAPDGSLYAGTADFTGGTPGTGVGRGFATGMREHADEGLIARDDGTNSGRLIKTSSNAFPAPIGPGIDSRNVDVSEISPSFALRIGLKAERSTGIADLNEISRSFVRRDGVKGERSACRYVIDDQMHGAIANELLGIRTQASKRRLDHKDIGDRLVIAAIAGLTTSFSALGAWADDSDRGELDTATAFQAPAGGTATMRPIRPGENVVYHIDRDGVPREVFRARVLVHSLAWRNDSLLIGTGPDGELYEVRDDGRETTPLARLDSGQILSLVVDPDGSVWIGSGEPAAVGKLKSTYVESGTLVSDVLDAKLISRFGTASWRGENPLGTSTTLEMRTGNVGEPDETWAPWSSPVSDASGSKTDVPAGRFAQFRLNLKTSDPTKTPDVRSIAVHYQSVNLPPELTKIDVPDVVFGDGSTRGGKVAIKWTANDPNGDELSYMLMVKKEGWPDWVELWDKPKTDTSFSWDGWSVPAGVYRARVTASDRLSNAPGDSLARTITSDAFVIDHEPPRVSLRKTEKGFEAEIHDDLTRVVKALYAVDGGDWTPIFPVDGLYDSTHEKLRMDLLDLKPGAHVVVVQATDAAGNTGSTDLVIARP